jgi:hypothetical protein
MVNHNHPMQLLRMIGIIASTIGAVIIIALVPLSNSSISDKIKKGEPSGSPFFLICCVVSEAR